MTSAAHGRGSVGDLLRQWRQRRRRSQLDLALDAEISTRHLSFVETGRSVPSREMVLRLAEQLEVPLRERNQLLLAAGYAPVFSEAPFDSRPMAPILAAVRDVLKGHEPYPAIAVDRQWNLMEANTSVALFTDLVAPALMIPPVNVLRVSLHPDGLAPRILNLAEWRAHILSRLRRQIALTADQEIIALCDELRDFPAENQFAPPPGPHGVDDVAVTLRIRVGDAELAFLSMVTTFGTPVDITVAELAVESFFPADDATLAVLRQRVT